MRYRAFKEISTGQWIEVLMSIASDVFDIPAESHVADIAEALGVSASNLEAVEGDSDPRPAGRHIALPLIVSENAQRQQRLHILRAKGRKTWTSSEKDELLELLAHDYEAS